MISPIVLVLSRKLLSLCPPSTQNPYSNRDPWSKISTRHYLTVSLHRLHVYTSTQSAVRRSFQQLRRIRLHSVNALNFQWTVFISNFMHMRDKTVCGFWAESLPLLKAGVDSASELSRTAHCVSRDALLFIAATMVQEVCPKSMIWPIHRVT